MTIAKDDVITLVKITRNQIVLIKRNMTDQAWTFPGESSDLNSFRGRPFPRS